MTADRRPEQLQALVTRIIGEPSSPFYTPGLAVITSRGDGSGERSFVGLDGAGSPITDETFFPLASASKLATGLAVLRLVEERAIGFDDSLARYLPGALAARPGVTLRALLSHTSGLPLEVSAETTTYTRTLDWPQVAGGCMRTPLRHPPGTEVQYSNVAYGLLALLVELVTGLDFPTALRRVVIEPLGIDACIGEEPPGSVAAITDLDSAYVGTELEPYNSRFWRALGLPWAGVYATADALLALLQIYADSRPDVVSPSLTAQVRADQTAGLGGGFVTTDPFLGFNSSRSIAWPRCAWGMIVELRGDKRPHWAPPAASPASFGQIGASGCVAWCDPERGAAWVILGPRTTDNGWILRHGSALGALALATNADR